MKHHYVRLWFAGPAVTTRNGRTMDYVKILRFDTQQAADNYVADYRPPNHCPQAYAERVTRKAIESYLPRQDQYGGWSDQWMASECGTYEIV